MTVKTKPATPPRGLPVKLSVKAGRCLGLVLKPEPPQGE